MKSNKLKRTLSILVLAGMTLPALADESTGWYFGAGLGQSRATIEEDEIRADLLTSGFGVSAFDDDERDFAYKLYTGYQFHRNFAMELGYFDLGEFGYSATTSPAGTLDANLEFDGWNLDLVGIAPISERASFFARIGGHHSKTNVDFAATGAVNVLQPRFSERATENQSRAWHSVSIQRCTGAASGG
ncbi:MAG: outer membrane beta-barrel protein [Gammaproteobacteria bacterium]|nr:outer membrane beta-barrel protein [Gammaproteobacteria bacterium]